MRTVLGCNVSGRLQEQTTTSYANRIASSYKAVRVKHHFDPGPEALEHRTRGDLYRKAWHLRSMANCSWRLHVGGIIPESKTCGR